MSVFSNECESIVTALSLIWEEEVDDDERAATSGSGDRRGTRDWKTDCGVAC